MFYVKIPHTQIEPHSLWTLYKVMSSVSTHTIFATKFYCNSITTEPNWVTFVFLSIALRFLSKRKKNDDFFFALQFVGFTCRQTKYICVCVCFKWEWQRSVAADKRYSFHLGQYYYTHTFIGIGNNKIKIHYERCGRERRKSRIWAKIDIPMTRMR